MTLPAPPPDTVIVVREAAPEAAAAPAGTRETLCLATGIGVEVSVTASGDTLLGPSWISVADLRPGLVFAGSYAEGREWFITDEPFRFENREYARMDGNGRPNCAEIVQVGEYGGVAVFADRSAERPFEMVYVPLRPGIWRTYRRR